jgi:subtilase family serine protease
LRISARDTAGSAVTQTITRAYPLSATPPAGSGTPPGPGPATRRACPAAAAAPYAQCMAIVNTAASGLDAAGAPIGYGPRDVQSAYRLPADRGEGRVVAIVDAYDNPNAEADLAAYRAHYGLPPCTTANGCFRKVNQHGQAGPLPVPDPGWGLEIALDLDAVSAACPACQILLVEADSPSIQDLGPAVNTAVALGATVVSNSYGSRGEFSGEQYFEGFYQHRGVPIVVASGDFGYGNGALLINSVSYPAASQYVVAVGGTSLSAADNARGWDESVWAGATSGCSAYIHKPGWQKDRLCDKRTVADVAAVADPATGLAVYDTFGGYDGWVQVGGTSLAAPIIASIYAMSDNPAGHQYASDLYAEAGSFNDVVAGSNGECGGTYLCTGVPGYDGPTGLGTPGGSL